MPSWIYIPHPVHQITPRWEIFIGRGRVLIDYHALEMLNASVLKYLVFIEVIFVGDHIYGRIGDLVDILSIVATVLGVCTSLGLGAGQLNGGLHRMNSNIEVNQTNMVIIIWALTARKILLKPYLLCSITLKLTSLHSSRIRTARLLIVCLLEGNA